MVYNFPQYSPEWWAVRAKKMTASNAQAIAAQGAGLKTYVAKLMAEYYSTAPKENFSNAVMQRGLDLEDSAGFVYSMETGTEVQKVGFISLNKYVGCSPDLLTMDGGLCELKVLADKAHFALILGGEFESKYRWQAQCQLLITDRKYCDLTSYNPNYKQNLIVKRLYPDKEKFKKLQSGFIMGKQMIEEIERKMS